MRLDGMEEMGEKVGGERMERDGMESSVPENDWE